MSGKREREQGGGCCEGGTGKLHDRLGDEGWELLPIPARASSALSTLSDSESGKFLEEI